MVRTSFCSDFLTDWFMLIVVAVSSGQLCNTLNKHQHQIYSEKWKAIWLQAAGLIFCTGLNLAVASEHLGLVFTQERFDHYVLEQGEKTYLFQSAASSAGLLVVLLTVSGRDYFALFNRLPEVTYSML